VKESLIAVLPSDHRCCPQSHQSGDLVGETFIGVAHTAPVVRAVVDDYLKRQESISSQITSGPRRHGSVVNSVDRGIGLLPAYAQNFLHASRNESSS